jgi:hypothetical protein
MGAYHEIDSSAVGFEIAASTAMRNGATSADVRLLEPIMDIEVALPGDFIGSVIALGTTLKYRTGTAPRPAASKRSAPTPGSRRSRLRVDGIRGAAGCPDAGNDQR